MADTICDCIYGPNNGSTVCVCMPGVKEYLMAESVARSRRDLNYLIMSYNKNREGSSNITWQEIEQAIDVLIAAVRAEAKTGDQAPAVTVGG